MALGKPAVVADGDKGDITVSSSGDTWTIDNSVVDTSNLGGDITTAGKALLDDADAAAQRTTLGLGTMATANTADYLPRAGGTMTGTLTVNDTNFTLRDETDNTKQAQFQLSGITTATTRTYTLPNLTGTLATTGSLTQTFSGATTFSSTFTASGATVSLGTNTGASTINVGTGATTGTNSKVINIGNGHTGTGPTAVNILTSHGTQAQQDSVLNIGQSNGVGASLSVTYCGAVSYSQYSSLLLSDLFVPITQRTGFLDDTQVNYDLKSKSVASEDATPTGMYFKPDGTSVFILGDTNDRVYRYDMSTAWDISTAGAVASTSPSLAAQSTTLSGLTFSPDGTKMYVASGATDLMYQYTLSTAWDVSTATYANKSAAIAANGTPNGIFFDSDGRNCIYVNGSVIYQFGLTSGFDLATASSDRRNTGRLYYHGSSSASYLCPTSGFLFYSDTTTSNVAIIKLWPDTSSSYGAPSWNRSIRHIGDYYDVNSAFEAQSETPIGGIWYNDAIKKFYMVGSNAATIFQHSVGWNPTTSWSDVENGVVYGVSKHYGYNHFEGGVWYNDVRLDQRLVPAGGTTGQTLRKTSGTDYAYSWSALTRVGSTASSATITPTGDASEQYNVTALATAATFAVPSGTPTDGQRLLLRVKDDGTARGLTWTTTSGGYRAIGVTLPTTTVASKVLYVDCRWNSQDSFWDVTAVAQE